MDPVHIYQHYFARNKDAQLARQQTIEFFHEKGVNIRPDFRCDHPGMLELMRRPDSMRIFAGYRYVPTGLSSWDGYYVLNVQYGYSPLGTCDLPENSEFSGRECICREEQSIGYEDVVAAAMRGHLKRLVAQWPEIKRLEFGTLQCKVIKDAIADKAQALGLIVKL